MISILWIVSIGLLLTSKKEVVVKEIEIIDIFEFKFNNPPINNIESINKEIEDIKELAKPKEEYLGTFRLTGYCPCEICCGKWSDGITATGTIATQGRTIAVDPKLIPLGSSVRIEGIGTFIAEDTGSAINEKRIDVYKDNHFDCYTEDCNGYYEVYLIK